MILKMQVKVMMYNIRNNTGRWQIRDFLYYGISNVCSIFHRLRYSQIKKIDKIFTLKMKVKVKE